MSNNESWNTGIPPPIFAKLYCDWNKVKREVKLLDKLFKKYSVESVIEYGCGIGRHGYLLSKLGYDVLLTDIHDWRYGRSRRLKFRIYDVLKNGSIGEFDAGFAIGLVIIFDKDKIPLVLKNMLSNIKKGGILVFDYNFTTLNEPPVRTCRVNGRKYTAILKYEHSEVINGGWRYRYRIEVYDENNNLVGVEDTGYPVLSFETFMDLINKNGFKIVDIIKAHWNPDRYVYEFNSDNFDSAFIVIEKV